MKVTRFVALMLTLSLMGAATAAASSMWGEYEGFSKVRLTINKEVQSFSQDGASAFLIKGNAVLPVHVLSESLRALVKWDSSAQTVSVHKPNVHMFVAKKVDDDYSVKQPFGGVKKGDRLDFAVFTQVDSLTTPFHSFKISIETPSGDEAVPAHEKVVGGQKENFWYPWPFTVSFNKAGNYKVKFSIMQEEGGDYVVVSEKVILSE